MENKIPLGNSYTLPSLSNQDDKFEDLVCLLAAVLICVVVCTIEWTRSHRGFIGRSSRASSYRSRGVARYTFEIPVLSNLVQEKKHWKYFDTFNKYNILDVRVKATRPDNIEIVNRYGILLNQVFHCLDENISCPKLQINQAWMQERFIVKQKSSKPLNCTYRLFQRLFQIAHQFVLFW